jgi:peptide/nickel transport system substrate-binding protein
MMALAIRRLHFFHKDCNLKKIAHSFVITLVLAISSVLTAFAQNNTETILRYPISVDPEHLNPFTATTIAISTVTNNIYEGLVGLDRATNEPTPLLAESWTISPDQLTYIFKLRKRVLFHQVEGVTFDNNTREFKADDWIWAAKLSLNKDEKISKHPEWMKSVVGAADFREGKINELKGLIKLDDYTIQITLSEPNRLFLITLGVPAVSRAAYEQLGNKFANYPVGTGPFQFVEWKRDAELTLKANPDYWQKGFPIVDGVRFINVPDSNTAALQYRQNELDFLFVFPPGQRGSIVKEFASDYHEKPGLNLRYFGFRMNKGFFADNPKVRQGFAHAFNRALVWNTLMEGARYPANLGVLPPAMPASTPATTYAYDLDLAAKLLVDAGFPKGEGIPEIKLHVFASAKDELSFPVLQDDLGKLGVKLSIAVEDDSTYWQHIGEDDVLFFLSGWSSGRLDPADVFNYLFMDGQDNTKYNNPKVNELLRAALKEFNPDARTRLYQQAHDLIMADAPVIASAYSKVSWLQKPAITGFEPGGGGAYTAQLWKVQLNTSGK